MKRNVNEKFLNTIIHGDALRTLDQVANGSIDLVLTDPPYFLDKLDENWKHGVVANKKNQQVIRSLPAGMKFDRAQGKRFYEWYFKVSEKIYRALKPGGFFFSFSSPRLYHRMASAMDDAGFEIRDSFLWLYTQNQMKAMSLNHFIDKMKVSQEKKDRLKKKLDGWKTPQIKSCYEPIAIGQKPTDGTFLENMARHAVGLFDTSIKVGNNMFPSNIMTVAGMDEMLDRHFLIRKPSRREKGAGNIHMTVKPLVLCEHLIELATFREDSVVLDPFMGSGTTALAAMRTGRNFIGIEINQEYITVASERLRDAESENLFPAVIQGGKQFAEKLF